MQGRSVQQQIDALRSGVASGFAPRMHLWFLAGAAVGVIGAIIFWHPVPLMIALFLGVVGVAERRAGPNIAAAVAAFDCGTAEPGVVSIGICAGDMDDHYHARVSAEGHPDWDYEFIPQGWRPVAGSHPASIWRDEVSGRPLLAAVAEGILIPRSEPQRGSG